MSDGTSVCVVQAIFRMNLKMGHTVDNVTDLIVRKTEEEAPQLFSSCSIVECVDYDKKKSSRVYTKAVKLEIDIPCREDKITTNRSDYHTLQRFICAVAKAIHQEKIRVRIANVVHYWSSDESKLSCQSDDIGHVE